MKHVKALIFISCMAFIFSCKTTNQLPFQESKETKATLVVATAHSVLYAENTDESFKEPTADSIESNPPHPIEIKQSVEFVQAVKSHDIRVRESFESVLLHTVTDKTMEEEMPESGNISKKETTSDSKRTFDTKNASFSNEYYVQVGSWKNFNYAEEIFIKLKEMYSDVHLVMHNNFYKVRISGVRSKKQGAVISALIEEKFNMKSLLVLKIQNTTLDDAVRPFIGTSYREINCYGLIVRGLINQGVQYHGQGGLREKLENLALLDGLPDNAYLNGEGLVEKAGKKIFSNFTPQIFNIREETDNIYSKIAPYLREGIILSFSTTTRGHTGIVSRWEDHWTYINSGVIDNQITSSEVSERVGEEFLEAEIENWVVLASNRKEPLTVTLGEIDESHLSDFDWLIKTNKLSALNTY